MGLSEGAGPVTVVAAGVVWMYCTTVGCYWTRAGGTAGSGAFVQYAQPLVSGSRPSWSRPTQADSGQSRRQTMTTGLSCGRRIELDV